MFLRAVSGGDANEDGVPEVLLGYPLGDGSAGSLFRIYLRKDGTVSFYERIGADIPEISAGLKRGDLFGRSLSVVGDIETRPSRLLPTCFPCTLGPQSSSIFAAVETPLFGPQI